MALRKVSAVAGLVQGRNHPERLICQFSDMINSKGAIWSGGNPFAFSLPLVLAQFILIFFATTIIFALIKPLKQSWYSSLIFRPEGRLILQTIADIGFMFHLFVLGVQVDPTMLRRAGRTAMLIGASSFGVPVALGGLGSYVLPHLAVIDDTTAHVLQIIAVVNSASYFPVITSLLGDLKILNSEIGRIATLASSINDVSIYVVSTILITLSTPFMKRVARTIPERGSMRESQFLMVAVLALLSGFVSRSLGQPAAVGSFILGLVVPEGPPLGSSLVYKIDSLCTGLLLPAKFAISGLSLDIFTLEKGKKSLLAVKAIILLGYLGKFAGTLVPAVQFGLSFRDAIPLALIMCSKGNYRGIHIITDEAYVLWLITMLVLTGIIRPLVWYLYDPSRRYSGYRTNSIQYLDPTSELRVQVYIHNEDNVPSIVNLLEASNPSRRRPIAVFVLNLMELKGRAAALLVPTHNRKGKAKFKPLPSRTGHISNALNILARRNQDAMSVQHFTSIVPYATMHDETYVQSRWTKVLIL
ncbi:hypothetical protein P3S67_030080 [Capsicum chacoense]